MFSHWLRSPVSGPPRVDNFISQLCYRWSTSILLTFSFVVTCRLLLGDSFECISADESLTRKYVNAKCYADGTYTILSHLIIQKNGQTSQNYRRYYSFYQWVNLLFLVHAFNFYLPHLLWKAYDNGRTRRLTVDMQSFLDKDDRRGLDLTCLAKYIIARRGKRRLYLFVFVFLEAVYYAVSLAQTLWLIKFFDVTGVPKFLPFDLETWSDFRQMYFPPTGICEVMKYTHSGSMTRVSAICEMPLNRLFMYMFLFLHAWYLFVTILTGLVLVYRIVLLVPAAREIALMKSAPMAEGSIIKSLSRCMSYSDWFFLTQLQSTMADVDFAQLLDKLDDIIFGKYPQKDVDDKLFLSDEKLKELETLSSTSPI